MPDHVHVLITPATDQSTSKCIQYLKGGYSFAAHQAGAIWHTGYHEHRIRDAEDFNNQLQYIANNPSRKQYEDYPHIHTRYPNRIDPMPSYLLAKPSAPCFTHAISSHERAKARTATRYAKPGSPML